MFTRTVYFHKQFVEWLGPGAIAHASLFQRCCQTWTSLSIGRGNFGDTWTGMLDLDMSQKDHGDAQLGGEVEDLNKSRLNNPVRYQRVMARNGHSSLQTWISVSVN